MPSFIYISATTDNSLKFTVNVTANFTIPTKNTETYLYDVDWGDGNQDLAQTGNKLHTYGAAGSYQITITGTFPKFFFNNTGDKLLLTSIDQWGNVGYALGAATATADQGQYGAFNGCANLTSLADDCGWMNSILSAYQMFSGCTGLTVLPTALTLDALYNGALMFPSATGLLNINNLTLTNLAYASSMFQNENFTSLPSAMVLDNLIDGSNMFLNGDLTSLPTGMVLGNLTLGVSMFLNCNFTEVPSGMTLGSLTNGTNMFNGVTLTTASYDTLLNNMVNNTPASTVTFNAGASTKYTAGNVDSGTTDGATTAFKLIDSTQNFNTTVTVGDVVRRTVTNAYAFVNAIDSDTQLTLSHDIMVTGVAYTIQGDQAAKDRAYLDLTKSWTITDGGPV